jgi:hypothetical protein
MHSECCALFQLKHTRTAANMSDHPSTFATQQLPHNRKHSTAPQQQCECQQAHFPVAYSSIS